MGNLKNMNDVTSTTPEPPSTTPPPPPATTEVPVQENQVQIPTKSAGPGPVIVTTQPVSVIE